MADKKLTQDDVSRLLSNPSTDTRVETATKIAGDFNAGDLSDNERQLAEEIFRVMVKDAEVRVREALALNLKESSGIPHDVAVSLAKDVEQVALPVLQFSDVLTDNDLIEIINSHSAEKQTAIAKRKNVSEDVSDVLVEAGNEEAVPHWFPMTARKFRNGPCRRWSIISATGKMFRTPWFIAPSCRSRFQSVW